MDGLLNWLRDIFSVPEGLLLSSALVLVVLFVCLTLVFQKWLRETFSGPAGLLLFPALSLVTLFACLALATSILPNSRLQEVWAILGNAGSILAGAGSFFVAMALGASFLTLLMQNRQLRNLQKTREEEVIEARWYKLLGRLSSLPLAFHDHDTGQDDLNDWFAQSVAMLTLDLDQLDANQISPETLTRIAGFVIDNSVTHFSPGLVETFSALRALRAKAADDQRAFLDDSLAAFTSQKHIFCVIFESIAKRRWDVLTLFSETRVASFHLGFKNAGVQLLERVIWIHSEVQALH
jgi:hypothetical protein